MGRRWWCGFRAHARCRSETGAPGGGVVGAGFALTRDAGRRPALLGRRRWGGFRAYARCRSETGAPHGGVVGAGFALPRDAGQRPALHGAALVVRVSRSRAMPVGDRRSRGRRCWGGFRAYARCRSETGAPGAASLGRVSRSRAIGGGRCWGGFRAYARCRSEDRRSWPSLRFTRGGVLPSACKTNGSEPLVRCRRFRGNV